MWAVSIARIFATPWWKNLSRWNSFAVSWWHKKAKAALCIATVATKWNALRRPCATKVCERRRIMQAWKIAYGKKCNGIFSGTTFKWWWRRSPSAWGLINPTYALWHILIYRVALNPTIKKPAVQGGMICRRKRCCSTIRRIMCGWTKCWWKSRKQHNAKLNNINCKPSANLPRAKPVAVWSYWIISASIVKQPVKIAIFVSIPRKNTMGCWTHKKSCRQFIVPVNVMVLIMSLPSCVVWITRKFVTSSTTNWVCMASAKNTARNTGSPCCVSSFIWAWCVK